MDTISHALWTNLIFKELPPSERAWAISFGIMPDIISFSLAYKHFLKKTLGIKGPKLSRMPKFVFKLYNYTHSFIIWLLIYFVLRFFAPDWISLAFFGWALHIFIDIFTHKKNYFPTPFLWPISKYKFSGINWTNRWFMLFNYAVLIFLYLVFYL